MIKMAEKAAPVAEPATKSVFTVIHQDDKVTESYLAIPDIGCILKTVTAEGYVAQTFLPRTHFIGGTFQQAF